ncbi:MAG: hypothetical protein SVU32_02840, partial [Candidatus Nanohaloarchaea archaeon]|nr:hypothetical protein [Candidatus Nanohaloarchaea archaeon]
MDGFNQNDEEAGLKITKKNLAILGALAVVVVAVLFITSPAPEPEVVAWNSSAGYAVFGNG